MCWKKALCAGLLALLGLSAGAPLPAADDATTADEKILEKAEVGTEADCLVAFLRQQTRADKERARIEALVRQLGDPRLEVRDAASESLVAAGVAAVPLLRRAQRSGHLEVAHRAGQCLAEISGGPDPTVTAAALRLLARRPAAEAVPALVAFVPFAGEEWVEEEVLTSLGTLGVKDGKPGAELQAALQDPVPARRAAAACVVARWGDLAQRPTARQMLADPDFQVRSAAARGLLGDRFQRLDVPLSADDRKLVKAADVTPDAAGLLAFFRSRTLSDEDRKRLERLVEDLDSPAFATRQEAARKLVAAGTPALPFIAAALARKNGLEMTRRLESCKGEIEKGPGPALPMAAARLLVRRAPPEAVPVLLAYAPFADDSAVEDEVTNSLAQLAVQGREVPEALIDALKDELPARRGAAALVLGLVGDKEQVAAVKLLLADDEPRVRLRAAQGLLAARDKGAVPVLIALLGDGPTDDAVQAEELLRYLGGEKAPALSISDGGPDARKKGHEAWAAWWHDHGDALTLAGPVRARPYLGLTLVAELGSGRRGAHRLWEFGRDDKVRWETTEPINPIDAHILPNNRVLVAEYGGYRVTERDLNTKKVLWEKRTSDTVVSCQRLANGNTFIATNSAGLTEVTPDGREVYHCRPAIELGGIVNAIKLRNGTIACCAGNKLVELDTAGKLVKTTVLDPAGGWNGVEELPGGRLLVALQQRGKVIELDTNRKTVWECAAPGAVHAVRLPDGHTLVACGNTQKLLEVDRGGKVVWEKTTTGRPFHVRRR